MPHLAVLKVLSDAEDEQLNLPLGLQPGSAQLRPISIIPEDLLRVAFRARYDPRY